MTPHRRKNHPRRRKLAVEGLERRTLLTGLPYGAMPDDTGELMLGDVHVTVVLMESSDQLSTINDNSETWSDTGIAQVKQNVEEGLQWWRAALANLTDKHQLDFQIDFTYADSPVATRYEPITRRSTDFQFWIYDFLNVVGFNQSGSFSTDIRAFNHSQRLAHDADWAFTIFVVNDEHDADGMFAPGGFSRAFAFSGGRFFVMPAGRPASTVTHESGHMFWARDEYFGGGSYASYRGYYNTQNLNAADNPAPGFRQVPSVMETGNCEEGGGLLCTAYQTLTSSPESFAMIGWQDSDGDGVFDALDVPHRLSGSGYYDAATGMYHFLGESSVQTLPNQNPSGLQNDITLNRISRLEYRIDAGNWETFAEYDQAAALIDVSIAMPLDATMIELRTIDDTTGVSSPIFQGYSDRPSSARQAGIQGFLWNDLDADGIWESGEPALEGWAVELIDEQSNPLVMGARLEPDDFPQAGTLVNTVIPEATLTAQGPHASSSSVASVFSNDASTGSRVFGSVNSSCGGFCIEWSPSLELRIELNQPSTRVSLDAIGRIVGSYGRLEIYDATDNLLARTTSQRLADGQVETLTLSRDAPDIAYAIASGHAGSTVLFDNLRVGPESNVVTDSRGAFTFGHLPSGEYRVRADALSSGLQPTNSDTGVTIVTLAAGSTVDGVSFGFGQIESPWRNTAHHLDVNGDGAVVPGDALQIINDLNHHGPRELTNEETPPYLDTNGDFSVTAQDVLLVINFLNSQSGQGEGGHNAASAVVDAAAAAETSPAEGEGALRFPRSGRLGTTAPRPAPHPSLGSVNFRPGASHGQQDVDTVASQPSYDRLLERESAVPLADSLLSLLADDLFGRQG